ncbi:MAG: ATP-binding cassette domain-containing protein [Actinomycetota bacterium]|nr:ATP-binding cassette domain-containing protein [Actinomycetota bacterium]
MYSISSPFSKQESLGTLGLEGVTVRFGEVPALQDVSIVVEPGERLSVIGASGAGKSTLFRTLTRSVTLSNGRVTVGERDLYALSKKELNGVRRCVGTVYQAYNLVPQLPAGVNAALGEVGSMGAWETLRTFLSGPDTALASRVADALDRVDLKDKAHIRTANLSGGQQQRVAVARLLVQHPGLILADEPFAAVDPLTTEGVMEALLELNGEGATLLVNLHNVQIARRFPRVVALREGRVVFDGSPERLTDESLSRIYAGDPYGTAASSVDPQNDIRFPTEHSVRLMEGRDGVSSH